MQKTVEISVIIAAYNVENYLADCLDSLLKQTYKNIEIKILQTLNDIRKFIYIPTLIAIKIKHCFKKLTTRAVHDYRGYALPLYDLSKKYDIQENKTSLRVLSELGLVKYYCGHYPVITKFGCEFVEELEKYNTVDKK